MMNVFENSNPSQMRLNRRESIFTGLVFAGTTAFLGPPIATMKTASAAPGNVQPDLDVRYILKAGGLQAAQLAYTAERREAVLASRLAVQSSGFLAAFKSVRTEVEAQSHLNDNGELRSARYRFAQVKSDESKYVDIDYAADGSIRDLRIERDGKVRKTKVPEEHWAGTVDPLTAIAAIRRDLGKGLLSSNHPMRTYRVFDGRKRYDIHMTWLARIDDDQNPLETSAHKIVANRTPVAGYDTDDEDWQRHLRGEQRPLQLRTTADQQAIPYLAMSTQSLVEREIKLEQLCIDKKCYPS